MAMNITVLTPSFYRIIEIKNMYNLLILRFESMLLSKI